MFFFLREKHFWTREKNRKSCREKDDKPSKSRRKTKYLPLNILKKWHFWISDLRFWKNQIYPLNTEKLIPVKKFKNNLWKIKRAWKKSKKCKIFGVKRKCCPWKKSQNLQKLAFTGSFEFNGKKKLILIESNFCVKYRFGDFFAKNTAVSI